MEQKIKCVYPRSVLGAMLGRANICEGCKVIGCPLRRVARDDVLGSVDEKDTDKKSAPHEAAFRVRGWRAVLYDKTDYSAVDYFFPITEYMTEESMWERKISGVYSRGSFPFLSHSDKDVLVHIENTTIASNLVGLMDANTEYITVNSTMPVASIRGDVRGALDDVFNKSCYFVLFTDKSVPSLFLLTGDFGVNRFAYALFAMTGGDDKQYIGAVDDVNNAVVESLGVHNAVGKVIEKAMAVAYQYQKNLLE